MTTWPPGMRSCVLERRSPQARLDYMNEEQRNVHIWNSAPVRRDSNRRPKAFRLLASLYVDATHRPLRTHTLYRWLDFMTDTQSMDPITFAADPGNDDSKTFRLLQVPDPRTSDFPTPQQLTLCRPMRATRNRSDQFVEQGHYIIVKVHRRGTTERLDAHTFDTHPPVIDKRSVSRTATNSAVARHGGTRTDARYRDLQCRISGQVAPTGSRGWDFTGLEVAHVFPLNAHSKFPTAFSYDPHKEELYDSLSIPRQPGIRQIDLPANTLLLRADIHSQFDAYQFGIESNYDPEAKTWSGAFIRVFERDGAFSIPRDRIRVLNGRHPEGTGGVRDVHPLFTTHHLLTGLLWHVAGNGLNHMAGALIPHRMRNYLTGRDTV